MADGKELKPKSFRIDDETAEKFKEIANTIGGNQQVTLARLIESYEMQSGKTALNEKKGEIEQFERYVNAITRLYMGSLEENQTMGEAVRTEYDALLKSKDSVIQDLQTKLAMAQETEKAVVSQSQLYADENAKLKQQMDGLKREYRDKVGDMQNSLDDRERLNKLLTDSCNEQKQRIEELKQEQEKLPAFAEKISALEERVKELEQQLSQEALKNQQAVLGLKEQHQKEIDAYQQKYMALLEQQAGQKK